MAEYIVREALLTEIAELHLNHKLADDEEMSFTESDIRGLVLCLPAADVAPVVHGRWVHDGRRFKGGVDWCHCSECGRKNNFTACTNYCPNCGARMDLGGTDHAD